MSHDVMLKHIINYNIIQMKIETSVANPDQIWGVISPGN